VNKKEIRDKEYNIYTDGSKKENILAGGIWSIHLNGVVENFRLSKNTDINDAELFAAAYTCILPDSNSTINLFIDNQNTCSIIKKILQNKLDSQFWKKCGNIQTTKILQEIIKARRQNHNVKITVTKVKAHDGIEGNEKADKNTKEGLKSKTYLITEYDENRYDEEVPLHLKQENKTINNRFRKTIKSEHEKLRKKEEQKEKNKKIMYQKIDTTKYDERWSNLHTSSLDWSEKRFRLVFRIRENNLPNVTEMKKRNDKLFKSNLCKVYNEGKESNTHIFVECKAYHKIRHKMVTKVNKELKTVIKNRPNLGTLNWFYCRQKNNKKEKYNCLAGMTGFIPKETVQTVKAQYGLEAAEKKLRKIQDVILTHTELIWTERNKRWKKILQGMNKETRKKIKRLKRRKRHRMDKEQKLKKQKLNHDVTYQEETQDNHTNEANEPRAEQRTGKRRRKKKRKEE